MFRAFEPSDAPALARIQQLAFGVESIEDTERWWDLAGREYLRVFEDQGAVVAGLLTVPMGMWAGGRRVDLHGVAGVAVAPSARGRGIAREMMRSYLRELDAEGVALSALYASTRRLYRGVGYGIAGQHFRSVAHPDALRGAGRSGDAWRPITTEDWPALETRRPQLLRHDTGALARGPYVWQRVRENRGKANDGWVLDGPDGPAAWLVLRMRPGEGSWSILHIVDWAAQDAESLRALVGFLSSFGAMARTFEFTGGPHDALLDSLPEMRTTQSLLEPFLLRVVSVQRALDQRGWPKGFRGTVEFELSDPLFATNSGRWILDIDDGRAEVSRGGSGAIQITEHGMAALFTGYSSPWMLRMRGLVRGQELETLAAAFAGPAPAMADFF